MDSNTLWAIFFLGFFGMIVLISFAEAWENRKRYELKEQKEKDAQQ